MSMDAHSETPVEREFKAYIITNARNGNQYVGITINPVDFRLNQHFYAARGGGEQTISHAIRAYGEENFSIRHLASAVSREHLLDLEKQLIAQYDTYHSGYNMTIGGEQTLLGTPVIVDGVEYLNVNDAADQLGIKSATARARIERGWTTEQAFGIEKPPPRPSVNGTEIEVDGAVYSSATRACEHFGVDRGAYLKRIELGWTKEQAFGLASPPPRKPVKGLAIKLGRSEYSSIAEACRVLKVDYHRTRARVANGWNFREAFDLEAHSPAHGKKMGERYLLLVWTFLAMLPQPVIMAYLQKSSVIECGEVA